MIVEPVTVEGEFITVSLIVWRRFKRPMPGLVEQIHDLNPGLDYTLNCATGFPAMTGGGSIERPVNHVLPAWDIACALQASTAVCAALLRRRAEGAGSALRIALSDVAFATLSHLGLLAEAQLLGADRPSLGNDIYGAFGRDFATADGNRIMVAAISSRQWKALVAACGMTPQIAAIEGATGLDFDTEKDRFKGRELIAALVAFWCEARSLGEVARVFREYDVCWGEYKTVRSLLATDRRVSLENPMFETVDTAGVGPHLSAGAAARLQGQTRRATSAAPYLGADTDEVLESVLGLPPGEIAKLHDRGIVAGPDSEPFAAAS